MEFRLCVVLPCYNVEKTVAQVVSSISAETLSRIHEVLAIDNRSTDGTFEALRNLQKTNKKLSVIRNAKNYGYGGSQKIAYRYAMGSGCTHLAVIHSDGQGNVDQILKSYLRAYDQDQNVDLVLASRFQSGSDIRDYSMVRTLGNVFFNHLTRAMTGLQMSDSGTAMMFVKTSVLASVDFESLTNDWQFHPQLNILLYSKKGIRVSEVPLNWKDSQIPSGVKLFQYGFEMLKILANYKVSKRFVSGSSEKPNYEIFSQSSLTK